MARKQPCCQHEEGQAWGSPLVAMVVGSVSAQGCLPQPPWGKTGSTSRWLRTPCTICGTPLVKKGSLPAPYWLGSDTVHQVPP